MKKLSIAILAAFFMQCASEQNPYFSALLPVKEGVFRGVSIRDGINKVKAMEKRDYLKVDEQVFLKYVYPFTDASEEQNRFELEYYFDGEDQLHEVMANIFIQDKVEANKLFLLLKEHYSSSYGEAEKNPEGYLIWKGKTNNTNRLEIALINDSENSESTGYISLQINDFDY
jgi:hypothetical protein